MPIPLDAESVPYVVGSGVTFLVLLIYAAVRLFAPRTPPPPRYRLEDVDRVRKSNEPTPSAIWAKRDRGFADRRSAVRRKGAQVRVVVSCPALPGGADWGYVLDRSTGGLRLALAHELPIGTPLQVRAAHAPDSIPWSALTIRNTHVQDSVHEYGCEFDQTPPWNILLLFG
jgi:hypothetical protein